MEQNSYKKEASQGHQVQFARPEDIPQIVSFGYKSFEENDLPGSTDFTKALNQITKSVLEDVVLVKRNDENPKLLNGTLAMQLEAPWFSNDPILTVFLFYIKPDHRSFKLAKELVSSAQEYAIINRLPIVFDLFAQKDVDKKKRLLKYLGFKECGSFFTFNT